MTAAAVLNVVEPYMTGLGGDMFAILWSEQEQRLVGINGSGRAGARGSYARGRWVDLPKADEFRR